MSPRPARTAVLGVDLGSRRIGLALADPGSGSVRPLLTLRRTSPERDAASLARICREQAVGELVVGLPLHMDGSEGPQAAETRVWLCAIEPALGLPVTLRDERLTSVAAEARVGRTPRGRSGGPPSAAVLRARRARIDREAAAALLSAELEARRQHREGTPA